MRPVLRRAVARRACGRALHAELAHGALHLSQLAVSIVSPIIIGFADHRPSAAYGAFALLGFIAYLRCYALVLPFPDKGGAQRVEEGYEKVDTVNGDGDVEKDEKGGSAEGDAQGGKGGRSVGVDGGRAAKGSSGKNGEIPSRSKSKERRNQELIAQPQRMRGAQKKRERQLEFGGAGSRQSNGTGQWRKAGR